MVTMNKVGMVWCSGNHSYAKVVEEEGPRKGALLLVGKWARAVICECQEKGSRLGCCW